MPERKWRCSKGHEWKAGTYSLVVSPKGRRDKLMEAFEGLPDITKEISEAFGHYDNAVGGFKPYAEAFLDAWLNMQKEEGIGLYYKSKLAKPVCGTSEVIEEIT